ncbi:MAG: SOS response-associated peptidase [Actinomycetota bacterium]
MCGRFTSLTSPEAVAAVFGTEPPNPELFDGFAPNYNVPPTSTIMVVLDDSDGQRRLGRLQWGLVPSWAKDRSGAARLINARSETVLEKPSFKSSVPSKRCIIPIDGFYEWRTVDVDPKAKKRPVYVTRRDGEMLAIAGLWATWRDRVTPSPALHSCCIITTAANATMSPVHDRMPVVLERDDWEAWLAVGHNGTSIDEVRSLMVPADPSILVYRDVSTDVNNVRNKDSSLIDAI